MYPDKQEWIDNATYRVLYGKEQTFTGPYSDFEIYQRKTQQIMDKGQQEIDRIQQMKIDGIVAAKTKELNKQEGWEDESNYKESKASRIAKNIGTFIGNEAINYIPGGNIVGRAVRKAARHVLYKITDPSAKMRHSEKRARYQEFKNRQNLQAEAGKHANKLNKKYPDRYQGYGKQYTYNHADGSTFTIQNKTWDEAHQYRGKAAAQKGQYFIAGKAYNTLNAYNAHYKSPTYIRLMKLKYKQQKEDARKQYEKERREAAYNFY